MAAPGTCRPSSSGEGRAEKMVYPDARVLFESKWSVNRADCGAETAFLDLTRVVVLDF